MEYMEQRFEEEPDDLSKPSSIALTIVLKPDATVNATIKTFRLNMLQQAKLTALIAKTLADTTFDKGERSKPREGTPAEDVQNLLAVIRDASTDLSDMLEKITGTTVEEQDNPKQGPEKPRMRPHKRF